MNGLSASFINCTEGFVFEAVIGPAVKPNKDRIMIKYDIAKRVIMRGIRYLPLYRDKREI